MTNIIQLTASQMAVVWGHFHTQIQSEDEHQFVKLIYEREITSLFNH